MSLFGKLMPKRHTGVTTLETTSSSLSDSMASLTIRPRFVVGFVSPHVDIDKVASSVRTAFPEATLMLCSTAGELCSVGGAGLYCTTGQTWDRVVLQCFDGSLIQEARSIAIPLGSEDLRGGTEGASLDSRIAGLVNRLKSVSLDLDIDYRDTLAYVMVDGLSASESFLMEALYESGKFPCLFVGGSAGGKFDFKNTWIHDGKRKLENHALVTFIKVPPGVRFGVFKSQNFAATSTVYHVIQASVVKRFVSHVIDSAGHLVPFVEALCRDLKCSQDQLEAKLAEYSFAIRVGQELFVRSIARFDFEAGRVYFFCDIAPGEELILVRRTAFVDSTEKDFQAFMRDKPVAPVAGILNDCILRRLYNEKELSSADRVFGCRQLAGFSTFGEILGLNLNQTLTAIFFLPGAGWREVQGCLHRQLRCSQRRIPGILPAQETREVGRIVAADGAASGRLHRSGLLTQARSGDL